MRIAALHGAHNFVIENTNEPSCNNYECVIRVRACGVCHSELHQWTETLENLEYPRYIGHEVAGEIVTTGKNVENFSPGDRVAVWTDQRGYAEKVAAPARQVFPIDDSVSFPEAMAEPVSCTTNAVIRANIEMADTVAVVGCGFMGLILIQQIKLKGASKIIAVDIRKDMLSVAQAMGADIILNPRRDNVPESIKAFTGGKGTDITFEVGGNQHTLDMAAGITRMEGKLVIFGYHPGQRIIHDLGYWNWMAFDIINAHFRDLSTILRGADIGVRLMNSGQINMKPLITHPFPLENIEEAFQAAESKPEGFIKAVIVF